MLLKTILREPLVYFLLAGAALFALTGPSMHPDSRYQIVISAGERQRMNDQWLAQAGREPTPQELDGLLRDWIREEIYYREARALGLDEDDVIVRRRLAQKLAFMTEDLATAEEPDPQALAAYYAEHLDSYREPERLNFSHRFFSQQRHADAQAAAAAALSDPETAGDPFMLQTSFVARSQADIVELFGRDFANAVANLPTGEWRGPIRSAYGWHLVRIEARSPARQPPLEEVEAAVRADLRQAARKAANDELYEALRTRYQVIESR